MVGAAFVLFISGKQGQLFYSSSVVLLIVFIISLIDNIKYAVCNMHEKHEHELEEEKESKTLLNRILVKLGFRQERTPEQVKKYQLVINIIKFIVGAAGIVFGADLLTTNGSELARIIGISERIIGVTIIAVGTSLPELVTTITAIAKKESSLSLGNIIGANTIDLTLILPICALITGGSLPISSQVAAIDLPTCLIVAIIAMIPTLVTKKFARWQSELLLGTYIGYMIITTAVAI